MKIISASLKYVKGSHYKANLVANLVRGMSVSQADAQLLFCDRRIAVPMRKLLLSCVANAKHNFGLESSSLRVNRIDVGKAFVLKRSSARGRGRSTRIEKRFSTMRIFLSQDNVVSK